MDDACLPTISASLPLQRYARLRQGPGASTPVDGADETAAMLRVIHQMV